MRPASVAIKTNFEGPSAEHLRTLVPNTIEGMVFGTRDLKYLLGPSGKTLRLLGDCWLAQGSNCNYSKKEAHGVGLRRNPHESVTLARGGLRLVLLPDSNTTNNRISLAKHPLTAHGWKTL